MPSKVLIVDDDPLMHLLYKKHLETAGYELVTANDGSEAVPTATREQPSLILMDIMMDHTNGLVALRALKKTKETKAIPVIVMTSNLTMIEATRKESTLAGASGFLAKPFSPAQLLAEVQRFVPQA